MFGNQKGGVGKTLVSVMTATTLGQAPFNLKVAVIDVDNQKSVTYARDIDLQSYPEGTPTPFTVINYNINELQKNITDLDARYDVIIIDVAGKLDTQADVTQQEITKALMYVDVLLIPFIAGSYVFTATYNYLSFIEQVQATRALQTRKMKVYGFVNMYRTRSKVNQMLLQYIDTLKESNHLNVMNTYLNDYTLFKEADTMTSIYVPSSNDAAVSNFVEWFNELVQIIQN